MSTVTSIVFGVIGLISISISPLLAAESYDVSDVASSDVLNMRDVQPGTDKATDAKVVGEIPHDAKGIQATGRTLEVGGSTWRQVTYGGTTGWVNQRFLNRGSNSGEWADEDTLVCSGTEPFWGYEITGGRATLEDPATEGKGTTDLSVKARLPGNNRPGLWFVYAETEDKSQGLSAVINRSGQCSNGMSDYLYDLEIFLMGLIPGEGPVQGCCTIAPK